MSTSTYVTFLKDRDYHERMLAAVRALIDVNVKTLPDMLADYFETEDAEAALYDSDDLLEVDSFSIGTSTLPSYMRSVGNACANAVEINISKLPSNVKHIRVSRS